MIQDIQRRRYHNEYTPGTIRETDTVFAVRGREELEPVEETLLSLTGTVTFRPGKE